jgi:hypothetical protein
LNPIAPEGGQRCYSTRGSRKLVVAIVQRPYQELAWEDTPDIRFLETNRRPCSRATFVCRAAF